jgi:hypothetical protein
VRKSVPIVAIVLMLVMVLAGMTYLLEITPPDVVGKSYTQHGVTGNAKSVSAKAGDLLDATSYITAWYSDRDSEKIVLQGSVSLSGSWFGSPLWFGLSSIWYKVTIRSNGDYPNVKINGVAGTSWESNHTSPGDAWVSGGSWIALPAWIVYVNGPYSGAVHVELWGHIQWVTIPPLRKSADFMLASDEAYLKSGIGHITVPPGVVEEGNDAVFHVTTGYSHSAISLSSPSGWSVLINDPSGSLVKTISVEDNFNGNIAWNVPIGSYRLTWSNQFWVTLRNDFLNQDEKSMWVVGVGMTKQIPPMPTIDMISGKAPFHPGDVVTLRLSATPNPIGYPITGFYVSLAASQGDIVSYYIFQSKFYDAIQGAKNVSYADVTFNIPDTGDFRMEAATFDTQHLSSGNGIYYLHVYEAGKEPTTNYNWVWIILAAVLACLAVGIGIWIMFYAPLPYPYGWIIAFVIMGVAIALAVWYIAGHLPSSAQIFRSVVR